MTSDEKTRAADSVREAREALRAAREERDRIERTLERSKRVRATALPALRRAGFVR